MSDDGSAEQLVILLEARISDLEKNMAKAEGVTTKTYRQMSLASKKATTQMENDAIRSTLRINQALASTGTQIGAFSKSFASGFAAPLAGMLTLTAAISGTSAALRKFSDINDKSIAAGVDSEFFQGIAFQAKLSGVEIDGVASALATFAKNSGLAAEGKGRMVSTLQALNPELLKNIQAATTQEQRVRLVANAIKNARDQAQAAAIATAAFGDGGEKLVQTFSGGADAIDETIGKARQLGVIVDRELITRADELGDKFDTVAEIIDTKLKKALVGLAPQLIWLEERVIDILNSLQDVQDLAQHPGDIVDVLAAGSHANAELLRLQSQMRAEIGQSQLDAALGTGEGPGGIKEATMGGGTLSSDVVGGGPSQRDLERWFGVQMGTAPSIPSPPPSSSDNPDTSGLGVAPETFDFRTVLDASKVDDVATGLGRVSKAAHDSTVAIGTTADAVDQLNQQWQDAEDVSQSFASTFIDDMHGGKSAIESVSDALGNLGDQLLQMAANQAIKSLFSSLLGSAGGSLIQGAAMPAGGFIPGLTGPRLFASGTANTGGRVGEPAGVVHGQEAVIPLPTGGRVPVTLSSSSASPSMTISSPISITVNAPGASREDANSIATAVAGKVLDRINARFPDAVQHVSKHPRSRGQQLF